LYIKGRHLYNNGNFLRLKSHTFIIEQNNLTKNYMFIYRIDVFFIHRYSL